VGTDVASIIYPLVLTSVVAAGAPRRLGTRTKCSPCHGMAFNSRNCEGTKRVE